MVGEPLRDGALGRGWCTGRGEQAAVGRDQPDLHVWVGEVGPLVVTRANCVRGFPLDTGY